MANEPSKGGANVSHPRSLLLNCMLTRRGSLVFAASASVLALPSLAAIPGGQRLKQQSGAGAPAVEPNQFYLNPKSDVLHYADSDGGIGDLPSSARIDRLVKVQVGQASFLKLNKSKFHVILELRSIWLFQHGHYSRAIETLLSAFKLLKSRGKPASTRLLDLAIGLSIRAHRLDATPSIIAVAYQDPRDHALLGPRLNRWSQLGNDLQARARGNPLVEKWTDPRGVKWGLQTIRAGRHSPGAPPIDWVQI